MTKVDIISGFLGAGKTTFIKKLIAIFFFFINSPFHRFALPKLS